MIRILKRGSGFINYGNASGLNGGGGPNRLYLNQLVETGEGLVFEDIAEQAGAANTRLDGRGNDRHSGPTFADMDADRSSANVSVTMDTK